MRFRRPNTEPTPVNDGGGFGRPRGTPDWLKEHIERQGGMYVLLSCGDRDDVRELARMLANFKRRMFTVDVYCERCQSFASIVRTLELWEYLELPPPEKMTDSPMF